MNAHRVEHAVILPINHPTFFPLSVAEQDDWLRANNDRQARLMEASSGRFIAYADVRIDGPYEEPAALRAEMERAVSTLHLRGVKLHPYNLNTVATDRRLRPAIHAADRLGIPIVVDSNPQAGAPDLAGLSPVAIQQATRGVSVPWIVAHLGGDAYEESVGSAGFVDVSGTLLRLEQRLGPGGCRELLRRIGIDRVLFGSDIPIFDYDAYAALFDRLALRPDELERIAYTNAARLLGI